jgi:prepilin-type N-terminal cleavage/methylation domain-containing protein
MRSHRKVGFTLIELLVVIAIIAILASILFPVFAQAKLAAKKVVDLSNMKQLGTAIVMYTNDYDDTMPQATGFNQAGGPGWQYGMMTRWSSQLVTGPYIKNTGLFLVPVDPGYTPNYQIDGGYWSWAAPIPSTRQAAPLSFMVNALSTSQVLNGNPPPSPFFPSTVTDYTGAFDPGGYYDPVNNGQSVYHSVTTTSATNPSDLIILTGGEKQMTQWWGGNDLATLYTTETIPWIGSDVLYGWDAVIMAEGSYFGSPDPNLAIGWRKYANQSNFTFSDTHAKTMAPGALLIGATELNPKYWLLNSDGF